MIIKGRRVGPLLQKTGREILDDNILGLSAQTAYYFFFSLFPLFLFAAPLIGFIGEREAIMAWLIVNLRQAVPGEAVDLVDNVVRDVLNPNSAGVISIGLLGAAWAGSNVFSALIDALNRAYDVEEGRPWWKKKLIALASVLVSAILFMVTTSIMLGGPEIAEWIERRTIMGEVGQTVWSVVQYPLAFGLLIGMLWLIYYFLPNQRQDKSQILVGATVAAVLWVLVTLLFRAYVANFGSYNKTYGAIGGVIVLLTWMYLTMLAILTGGELNAELHHGTASVEPRKGAVYVGRVVTARDPSRASNERVERVQPL
ncbi:MAG TPA: YihY/virulence factor BrkB family protein [Gemmatimonadaceae bacterium]|nr:YihY/virulence factor BrkB family protein [Gemmatimonadaceae bacterium]